MMDVPSSSTSFFCSSIAIVASNNALLAVPLPPSLDSPCLGLLYSGMPFPLMPTPALSSLVVALPSCALPRAVLNREHLAQCDPFLLVPYSSNALLY